MSYRTGRLLHVDRTAAPRSRCTDLVPLERDVCLDCGAETRTESFGQLPLIRHGGYGACETTTWQVCTSCRWVRVRDVTETRPPRRAGVA